MNMKILRSALINPVSSAPSPTTTSQSFSFSVCAISWLNLDFHRREDFGSPLVCVYVSSAATLGTRSGVFLSHIQQNVLVDSG